MRRKIYFLLFFFLCLTSIPLAAQDIEIKGMVTEATTNEPLPGVTVRVKGKDTGTVTDMDGKYSIKANKGNTQNHRPMYDRMGLFSWKGEPMNNDTSNRSTPATASPLTVKEAAPPVMIKKIGKTTYRVKIHFSETSKETMSDKIKRLILNDSEKSS